MTTLKNDLLIRALLRQPTEMTPIWLMRQAGRYLPEYREIRAKAGSFMALCQTPELACEVTLQPLRRFAFDAAILFSDILTIPDAMGLGLYFTEGEGPHFKKPLRDAKSIQQLSAPDPEQDLQYVLNTVRLLKKELKNELPLIGFSGSPWTLAAYMVEGGSSKNFTHARSLLYSEPSLLHQLLKILTAAVTDYLNAQIMAGVNAVMLFDSWGGLLTTENYQSFSLYYMQEIIRNLIREYNGQRIPVILFTKGGGQWLEQIANSGCDAIGIDWTTPISKARNQVGKQVALQGNLDPAVLYGSTECVREHVAKILANFGSGSGHIFNLGHGIEQNTPLEQVQVLVNTVHELSKQYH